MLFKIDQCGLICNCTFGWGNFSIVISAFPALNRIPYTGDPLRHAIIDMARK